MIRARYALQLAHTKFRSKKGILITSIVVASVLFAALVAAIITFSGAEKSALTYIQKSGNDRYLVKVTPYIPYEAISFGGELSLSQIDEIQTFEREYYSDLQDRYASLDIPYDESSEVSALLPAAWMSEAIPEEQRVMINRQSPVIPALEAQKYAEYTKTATNTFTDLQKIGNTYKASGYYMTDKPSQVPRLPNTRLITEGKENFGDSELKAGDMSDVGYFTNAIHNSFYNFVDEQLLSRYLLPQNETALKGIPVVVSAQEAASLFGEQYGISNEPAEPAQKLHWLANLQEKINGHVYQACYRNSAEQSMLQKIQQDYTNTKNNEGNGQYIKPSILYEYPSTPCGDITVKEDTRSTAEKDADLAIENKQLLLGTYIKPSHQTLTFQIVGIINAQPQSAQSTGVEDYIKDLLTPPNAPTSIAIPLQMYNTLPQELQFQDFSQQEQYSSIYSTPSDTQFVPRVLEFGSVAEARNFITVETCPYTSTDCAKPFLSSPYGSNYLVFDQIGNLFSRLIGVAFPIVLALAVLIIWFTVSRIMAENRKETAVYRAMGATRLEVTGIYLTYILLITALIVAVSFVLGVTFAYVAHLLYSPHLTDVATATFGIVTSAPQFSLLGYNAPLLLVVALSIVLTGGVASVQPLIRNVLRPPIRDIRQE